MQSLSQPIPLASHTNLREIVQVDIQIKAILNLYNYVLPSVTRALNGLLENKKNTPSNLTTKTPQYYYSSNRLCIISILAYDLIACLFNKMRV